jgi:hypothetical protein
LSPGWGYLIGSKSSSIDWRDFLTLQASPAKDPKAAILRSLSGTMNGTTRVRSFKGFTHGTFYFGFTSDFGSEFSLFCLGLFLKVRKLAPNIDLSDYFGNICFISRKQRIH